MNVKISTFFFSISLLCPIYSMDTIDINLTLANPHPEQVEAYQEFIACQKPLIIARSPFDWAGKQKELVDSISRELTPLIQLTALNGGKTTSLTNEKYKRSLNNSALQPNADTDPVAAQNIQIIINRLKLYPHIFANLQMLAVISQKPPYDNHFINTVYAIIARIADTHSKALGYPVAEERDRLIQQLHEKDSEIVALKKQLQEAHNRPSFSVNTPAAYESFFKIDG